MNDTETLAACETEDQVAAYGLDASDEGTGSVVIELTVNNHAGVMSHITGLFARRAFNLEGILCAPLGDPSKSRMYLLVNERPRMEQVIKQLEKLHDVIETRVRHSFDLTLFTRLHERAER
ncbi:MAG: ACT domain-containing protein [Candidatus Sumerlaeota bacterium]|nr:ACT domain-containing protein [Candidatus Sumerlaeota bacterium]